MSQSNDYTLLASRLNNYIMFQKREYVVNPDGSRELIWKDVFDAPIAAEKITIGGEEGRNAMLTQGEVRYRITIRWRDDVDNTMRIRIDTDDSIPENNRPYVDIKAPPRDPDGRRIMLEINGVFKTIDAWSREAGSENG